MKLLVFGRTGQVAREICQLAKPGLEIMALGRDQADLTDPAACAAAIASTDADAVINAAAYTAVDRAEEEEGLAHTVNAKAPGAMAQAAAAKGVPFLHVSTDYVFDGGGRKPWREEDPTGPLGAYGRTKLAGEQAVAAAGGVHVILRTAWVFAGHGSNFVATMLRVGKDRDRLTVVDDQRGGPTPARAIAAALVTMAEGLTDGATGSEKTGIFHFAGQPAVSWCGFAREIFARTGWDQTPEIAPIRTEDWPTPAARPANSVLDCSRVEQELGIEVPDWVTQLEAAWPAIARAAHVGARPVDDQSRARAARQAHHERQPLVRPLPSGRRNVAGDP